MDLTRRNVLNALGGLAGASAVGRKAAAGSGPTIGEGLARYGKLVAQAQSTAPPAAGLALVLRFRDGTSRTFSQAAATDAGDYIGQFVHQKCFMMRDAEWTVFFRPDADRSRDEIVVERGKMWLAPGESPTHIFEPYNATILKDGKRIAEVTVPRHWWMARWRWQSSPRPIRRSLRDLIAMKAICPLGKAALYGAKPLQTMIKWQGPMGTGGMQTGLGVAGERPEIGPITEYQAAYLLDGNADVLTTIMTQAEAVGSYPVWARDEKTGSLVDVYNVPDITFNYSGNTIPQPPIPKDAQGQVLNGFFVVETAHIPSPTYVPWLLTDDPYFYEGMEIIGNFCVLFSDYHRAAQKLPGLVYPGETRAWGWGMREIFRLGAFAPEISPSWLKPRAYWRKIAADNLTYTRQYMESPAKVQRIFRAFTRSDDVAPWNSAFVMSSLGWAVWSGFYPEWSEFTRWFAGGLLPFVNGNSGWDRRWPAPYYVAFLNMRDLGLGKEPPGSLAIIDASWDARTPDSWGEAWKLFPKWLAAPSTGFSASPQVLDPSRWSDPNKVYENGVDSPYSIVKGAPSGPTYTLILCGALAFAALARVPGAKEARDWLHSKIPAVCASYGATGFYKWSFQPA
jgi:hypothetical protein